MSLLFGVFNKRGEPVDGKWLELMAATTRLPRCQEPRIWLDGSFGFGITQRFDTPQDPLVAQPLHDDTAGVHIIATGRLDYRNDLARKLGIAEQNLDLIADVTLIHLAWLKWQQDCALHLEGDWTMAVWNSRTEELQLLRDSTGVSALHFFENENYHAFSTRIDSLLQLPFVGDTPSYERLTEILAVCLGDGVKTCYREISRLPPASRALARKNHATKVQSYRDPFLPTERPVAKDCFDEFVSIFERSVQCRMRSVNEIGLTLSSGYDSSSVAVAANRIAKERGQKLQSFSSVPLDPDFEISGRLANEAPIIRESCLHLEQIETNFDDASSVTPIQGMQEVLRACSEPGHAVVNYYWIVSLLRRAQATGVCTLLTGQLGNATISWTGTDRRAWNDILSGDLSSAALRWKRQRNRSSFLRSLKTEFVSPLLWRMRAAMLPRYLAHRWIESSYLTQASEYRREAKSRLISQRQSCLRDPRSHVLRSTCLYANPIWAALDSWTGISIRDATSDERLIRFCLALPDCQFQSPSEQRLLAARYLRQARLTAVVDSKYKGLQAADIEHRLALDGVHALLEQLPPNASTDSLLDFDRIKQDWTILQRSAKTTNSAISTTPSWLRAVAVACFLLGNKRS